MRQRIPEEKIAEVRQAVDIVDLIGEYVQLNKRGRDYVGLCPFHGEKTPSFSVSAERQLFHCFGCKASGNVFHFISEVEGLSFVEAVQMLAERANINLPSSHSSLTIHDESSTEASKMIQAHEDLLKLYHHILVNTENGERALSYLKERGFTDEVIEKFQLGFSLKSSDVVIKYLLSRKYDLNLLEKAGLIIKSNNDDTYFDRFSERIIFPIHDHRGKVVAFSGRSLNDEQAKYLNSPETAIFNKSNILYNYNLARPEIRRKREVILFEGYVDVIAASTSNIRNCVATMGTSLTDAHITTIKRNEPTVIICFDSDQAGIEASNRAATMLFKNNCNVKVAQLPDGYDPDDYIKKYGADKFQTEIIAGSLSYIAFRLQYLKRGKNFSNDDDTVKYINDALQQISILKNPVEREYYLRQLSEQFSISLNTLLEQQKQIYLRKEKRQKYPQEENAIESKLPQENIVKTSEMKPAYFKAERYLLAHMLRSDDVTYRVTELLGGKQFNIDEHQAIYTYLLGYYERGKEADASLFINELQDKRLQMIVAEIEMMSINDDLGEQELLDYIKQVFNYEKLLKIREKEEEKRDAEKKQDFRKAAEIAIEIIEIRKTL